MLLLLFSSLLCPDLASDLVILGLDLVIFDVVVTVFKLAED